MDARARRVFRQVVKTQVRSGSQTLMRCIKSAARAVFLDHLCGGEARSTGPQGDRHGCRFLFVRTGVLSKSPASAHGLGGRSPTSAKWGGLSFGHFSLATYVSGLYSHAEKSDSPSEGGRKFCFKKHNQERKSKATPRPSPLTKKTWGEGLTVDSSRDSPQTTFNRWGWCKPRTASPPREPLPPCPSSRHSLRNAPANQNPRGPCRLLTYPLDNSTTSPAPCSGGADRWADI